MVSYSRCKVLNNRRDFGTISHTYPLFGLHCLNPICPRCGHKFSSIASKGEGYLILAFLLFTYSNSSLIHANLSVLQRSFRVSLSLKVIRWQINLNLCSEIIAPILSWALSWFQITFLARILNLETALRKKMPMKVSISLSTRLTWLYVVYSSSGSINLSITVAYSCLYIVQCCPSFCH